MSVRDRIVEEASKLVGLCACKPWRSEFAAFLGPTAPGWTWDLARPYRQWRGDDGRLHTQGVSCCALTAERIWLAAGIAVPGNWYPYQGGTFVRTHTWPESLGAVRVPTLMPDVGDMVWTSSHVVAVVESWVEPWDTELDYQDGYFIEGGQVCLEHGGGHDGIGLQAIRRKRRRYWPERGLIAEVNPEGGHGVRSRVLGTVSVEGLPTP